MREREREREERERREGGIGGRDRGGGRKEEREEEEGGGEGVLHSMNGTTKHTKLSSLEHTLRSALTP